MLRFVFALTMILWAFVAAASGDGTPTVAGFAQEEALRLGEQMYREGILPSGEAMTAVVMGDVQADGRMFTCVDCHQRSGLGSVEGNVVAWPTNGKELYRPRRRTGAWRPPESDKERSWGRRPPPPQYRAPDARPAYTDETLARVLREGVDPTGRRLNAVMPRYLLNDRGMTLMSHYLKHLSNEFSPGVDDTTLRFATVVADEAPEADREAMLAVLQAHIEAHNAQFRQEERRARLGPFFRSEWYQAYRRLELAVWELTGPRETWRRQLEAAYREQPVFALLGGIASGSWAPIHAFCEQHRVPCLFPITDLPVISDTDWYTLYFSKGLYQEGEGAATYLRAAADVTPDVRMVQVFRPGGRGAVVARGFRETWEQFGRPTPEARELGADEDVTERFWQELTASQRPTVVLLWLEGGDLEVLKPLAEISARPHMVFVSSSLLGADVFAVPDEVRDLVYLTYPYSLPQENKPRRLGVKTYLRTRNIPATNMQIQAKMWFLGVMLPKVLKEIRSEFYREYFLEKMDMMADQNTTIAVYPRLTFGPGQRYASKGCYIVQVARGPNPALVKKSDWVTH